MITIVIPTRNEEKFLPGCLESLRNQDFRGDYEILIVDNGSTDRTAGIARSFGIKVIDCPRPKSVFCARAIGAAAATGDFIVQADADTLYPSGWLRLIAEQFAQHPEAVAVVGRFIYRDPQGLAGLEYFLRKLINRVAVRLFRRPLIISGATFAFRRSAFLAVNGYDGISYSPDQYGIASRLSKLGKIIYDEEVCVSTSSRSVQKPTVIVLRDAVVHVSRFAGYVTKSSLESMSVSMNKTRSRRVASRLFPVGMVIIMVAGYGYFIPASPVFGKVYYKANSAEKVVALTFDDGPNDPYTSQVLDVLDKYNVKATFFLVGKNVELYPDTAKRMIAAGNVIGDHSYTHTANHALTLYGSRDLEHAQLAITMVLGVTPHLYRPPHGRKSPWELYKARKLGLAEVNWSVTTGELHAKSATSMAQQIVKKTDPGEIILLHDGYGTEHNVKNADKSLTVQALPLIIEQLQAKGYSFVTVPQLLNIPAYNN